MKCNFSYKRQIIQVFSRHVQNIILFFIRLVSRINNSSFLRLKYFFPTHKKQLSSYGVSLRLVDGPHSIIMFALILYTPFATRISDIFFFLQNSILFYNIRLNIWYCCWIVSKLGVAWAFFFYHQKVQHCFFFAITFLYSYLMLYKKWNLWFMFSVW